MKVTEKDVAAVAALANLELTAAERERLLRDLNSVLGYIDMLNELDTTGIPPMAHTLEPPGAELAPAAARRFQHLLRADRAGGSLDHKAALANAPESDGTFFKVPKVIER